MGRADDEDLDRPMPFVQAVGVAHERPAPFQLPKLSNRGDVAARLAAIDAMMFDDPGDGLVPGPDAYDGSAYVDAPRADGGMPGAASMRRAADVGADPRGAAAIRGAAAVPAHARILLPEGAEAPGATSYADDDWRRHIQGSGSRAASRVYGPGGPAGGGRPPWAIGSGGSGLGGSVVGDPAPISPIGGDPRVTGPADADFFGPPAGAPTQAPVHGRPQLAPHDHGTTTTPDDESAEDEGKPLSTIDRIARIAVVVGIAGIFVVLFIFGPKISQWWSTH